MFDGIHGESWCILSKWNWIKPILITKLGEVMGRQGYTKKRPCSICRRWFMPHPRLKDRQRTCGDPECRREQHRRKCAEWNERNGGYFKTNFLQKKLGSKSKKTQLKSRLKTGLPKDLVQEVIGMQHLVIMEYLAQLIFLRFQDVINAQLVGNTNQTGRLPCKAFSRCDRL